MAKFKKVYEEGLINDINVTSLVDVTLTLLIMFMISTPLFQGGLEVVLPKTQVRQTFDTDRLVVTISKNKGIFLNDQHVTEEELPDKLAEYYRNSKIKEAYLRADEDIAYRKVTMVLAYITEAGFEKLGLVTEAGPTDLRRR
ncbi:MAG TPA: biopolymer transporter ExbD [archaeon]|nr:biopolymer transporter ExbD [archaeon]